MSIRYQETSKDDGSIEVGHLPYGKLAVITHAGKTLNKGEVVLRLYPYANDHSSRPLRDIRTTGQQERDSIVISRFSTGIVMVFKRHGEARCKMLNTLSVSEKDVAE